MLLEYRKDIGLLVLLYRKNRINNIDVIEYAKRLKTVYRAYIIKKLRELL